MKGSKEFSSLDRRSFFKAAGAGLAASITGVPELLLRKGNLSKVWAAPQGDIPTRVLGKTGMKLTVIGLGSHVNPANLKDPAGRVKQIRAAFDMGMNLFDVYEHTYHQFQNTSEALEPVRKQSHISLAWVAPENYKGEITSEIVRQVVENSLKQFKTDYIDLYRVVNNMTPAFYETMLKLKEEGKIRAVGYVAHFQKEFLATLEEHDKIDYLFVPYNAVNNKAVFGKMMQIAMQREMGIVGIKPFAAGSFFKMKRTDPQLKNMDLKEEMSVAQASLKFIINTKEMTSTIPQMNSVEEMKENLGALKDLSLGWEERWMLEEYKNHAKRVGPSYLPPHYQWLHEQWTA